MNNQEAKKLENKLTKEFKKLFKKSAKVICAVSGGPDSIFLLHILNLTLPASKIIVAHVNHQTRGRTTDLEEKFVKKTAEKYGNIFESISLNVPLLSKNIKKGLEETGRLVRYKFFEELAEKNKATTIVTAHHADDNLETIIMNFARGGSLKALCGMKKSEAFQTKFILIRPLLDISKKEIIAYLNLHKISYRTDKSNKDENYTRNFIRQSIIPDLQKINPNLAQSISRNLINLREIDDFLENEATTTLKKISNKKLNQLNAIQLRKIHPALQKQIFQQLHHYHAGHTRNLEKKHFDEILELLNKNIGNKEKGFGELLLRLKGNVIYLSMGSCKTYPDQTNKKTPSSTS